MPRRCLVTGANRGLGLEFVHQLLARGDRVVAACRVPGKASALNQLVGEHPGRLHVLPLDVTDPKSHTGLVRDLELLAESGFDGIDLLVNNAGVLHSGERFGHVTAANLEDSFRTNAMGPFLLAQALSEKLAKGGKIANITSELGSIGGLGRFGTPSYNISKAALNMASALLAQGLSERGIAVVALHPGWAQTDMGGSNANLPVADSVAGLLRVIDALSLERSGGYMDWQGNTLPW